MSSLPLNGVLYVNPYLINPTHQITVMLIGCGGTGSQVLSCLARMDATLRALDHPGLSVIVLDGDKVSEANLGRQLFSKSDVGRYKGEVLIERINRFFNLNWIHHNFNVTGANRLNANIIISCTDNIKSRRLISLLFYKKQVHNDAYEKKMYWLDFGNGNNFGQVILADKAKKLKNFFSLYPHLDTNEKESGPSCSIAEAIKKQDLFVNSTLAQLGCNILWKLIKEGKIEHQGLFMNLETLTVKPIKIP